MQLPTMVELGFGGCAEDIGFLASWYYAERCKRWLLGDDEVMVRQSYLAIRTL